MTAGWMTKKLGDVLELKRGYDLPQQARVAGAVPIISSAGPTGFHDKAMVRAPGVVTGRYGTIGQVFLINEDFWPLNTTLYVRDFKGNDPRFVSYLLRTIDFYSCSDKAAVPGVNRNHLHELKVVVPDVDAQRGIADVLRALDEKIDLNRRTSETLVAMARATFKSWFVDFDPVRAKKEGRKPEGMDAATAALFPDTFENSEYGAPPKGWSYLALSDVTSVLSRGIGPSYVDSGGVLVLNQKCVRGGRVDFSKARRHDPFKRGVEGRQLQPLDVLVNSTGVGTLGRVAQIEALPEQAIVDSHVTVVRAATPFVSPRYLGASLLSREQEIESLGEGSTGQTELSRARLGALPVLMPDIAVQSRFAERVEPMRKRITSCEAESRTLSVLRDALLPKLLSGELRVPQAERIVAEAV